MKKVIIASVLAVASAGTLCSMPAMALPNGSAALSSSGSSSGQVTMKPAEYNAYQNAISQKNPAAKAAAIEQFLKQYPKTAVKKSLLEQLMLAYRAAGKTEDMIGAAKRLLKLEPNNIRALVVAAYISKINAGNNTAKLDDAAKYARQGLSAPKPSNMSEAQFKTLKPLFLDVIGADQMNKKDYNGAIKTYLEELHSFSNPNAATTKGYALYDVYNLAHAYIQKSPKDKVNAIWYFTRAAQYLTGNIKSTAEKAAKYWYQEYHGDMKGYDSVVSMAKSSVFPPSSYTVKKYEPPTPEQLAHKAVEDTPNLDSLSLHDKEYILRHGSTTDANKVWDVLNGKVAEVPGVVISGTRKSVQLAVSPDAQKDKKADFTINMKKPLKVAPKAGEKMTYIAKFASFTQNPLMIIMNEGLVKPKPHPTHHAPRRR